MTSPVVVTLRRRLTVFAVLVVTAAVLVHAAGWDDVPSLRARVAGAGTAGAVLYALAYATLTLTPVPKNALSAAAGVVFGFTTGMVVVWSGAVTGALVAFGLARWLGRGRGQLTGGRLQRLNALLEQRGLMGALLVRLVPVLPFTVVNYGSGFTSLRVSHYVLGTAVGIIPGSVVFVAVGAGATGIPTSTANVLAVAAVLIVVGTVLLRRRPRR